MQKEFKAGAINKELSEIKKLQKSVDTYWTLWSNTCAGFLTLFCC